MEDIITLSQQLGINNYPLIIFNDNNKVMYTEFSNDEYQLAIRDDNGNLIGIIFNDDIHLLP
jgi:hypothetical protein